MIDKLYLWTIRDQPRAVATLRFTMAPAEQELSFGLGWIRTARKYAVVLGWGWDETCPLRIRPRHQKDWRNSCGVPRKHLRSTSRWSCCGFFLHLSRDQW